MKSLVEEASSVSKAIEKAWIRAGKPTSFSVKIYEEAQSGFLGFNSKPAKIGLFFEEQSTNKAQHGDRKRHSSSTSYSEEHKVGEKRPHHPQGSRDQGPREKRDQDDQRTSSNRRNRPQSFEKKEYDRNDRGDRNERRERSDRGDRNNRSGRPDRRRSDEQSFEKFEKKESAPISQTTFIPEAPATKQPETQQPQQQSTRRVLKVSSRRYVAPKNDTTQSTPTPSSSDDNSSN